MMINALHLLWIIPLTIISTIFVLGLAGAASREDFHRELLEQYNEQNK